MMTKKRKHTALLASRKKPLIEHLYVHIPFCTHICPYCAFYKTKNSLPEMKGFLVALKQELLWATEHFDIKPKTLFWGGGTPSALSLSQLEELFAIWPWTDGNAEFTLEANPSTISKDKAKLLLDSGVNRISLGVQSFDEASLKLLGRTHTEKQVFRTMETLREAGFSNINIDLMFALPGQPLQNWNNSLEKATLLSPAHISTYNLNYEEDTEFFSRLQTGVWQIDQDQERDFFFYAADFLRERGYHQYEISNFAHPGYEARHNLACWKGKDYLGLGPSACSTLGKKRWQNVSDIRQYITSTQIHGFPEHAVERLSSEQKRSERLILGLRTVQGVPKNEIRHRTQIIRDLTRERLIEQKNGFISLTHNGRLVADSVTELLI